jgi:glycosyltransferase involved in cell wall biosynthesis
VKIALLATDNRENFRNYAEAIPSFGTAPEALLQGFVRLPSVEVHVVSCIQRQMQSPERIADNIWYHGLHVPKIGWLRTGYQGCIRAIRKKLKSIQPDIVHGQGTERDCAISAVFSGFPNVVTVHGNMRLIAKVNRATPFSYMWLSAQLERFTIPRTDGVVCISSYTKRAVENLARKTWVVPNAVNEDFFQVQRAMQDDRILLCVGDIILRKNQNAFIHALDPLVKDVPFRLVFLGRASPLHNYSAEFLNLIKTRPWCQHVGFADRETVKQWLADARVIAIPSLEENCPMVLLEAMAAGTPVVASKVGGIPDLIREGMTGIFCDPTDLESMRTAVAKALTQREQAQAMARAAQEEAFQRFKPEIVARRHLDVYKDVLGATKTQ